ncbi:MAG: site-specific DNA-methyltransferase, partial [Synergistaceae bacterium]|nr:site-specific DNA-methyltransferase [Synergistaceae bacterium]
MLRQLLGDETAQPQEERYTFTWPGKSQARNEAELTPELTLRPCPEDSLNFNATGNIYIEGDNLDALRVIRKSLRQKVKMIYIDPPYNTGNDFIYRDNFTASREDYSRSEGSTDSEGFRVIKNTVANGRIHSDWCSMIYARLLVARDLLRHDGVIFISIDDNEQANL